MFICYNYYPQQPGNNYGSLFMVIQNSHQILEPCSMTFSHTLTPYMVKYKKVTFQPALKGKTGM